MGSPQMLPLVCRRPAALNAVRHLSVLISILVLSLSLSWGPATSVQAARPTPRRANNTVAKVYFKAVCSISHRNNDDVLLFPRQPGKSHSHDYFGSKIVNAYTSRTSELLKGGSSCDPPGNTVGYWIPTLYLLNKKTKKYEPSPPRVITAYYFNKQHGSLRLTEAYPPGLKMICGDSKTKGPGDVNPLAIQWFCSEDPFGVKYANFPVKCKWLVMGRVYCPSCWDGRLTSPDHKSHMAYVNPVTTDCPASHPRRLPEIHVTFTYNFKGTHWPAGGIKNTVNPPLAKLSTVDGAGWQYHMDVWEAWDPALLKDRMEKCYYAGKRCGPDGTERHNK